MQPVPHHRQLEKAAKKQPQAAHFSEEDRRKQLQEGLDRFTRHYWSMLKRLAKR